MNLPLNQSVLVESPSLRTSALSNLDDSRAQEVLSKAKAIVFAVWNGSGWATTAQIAEYFSVTESAVKELTRINQSEFQTQETKTLTGKDLRDARQTLCLPSRTSQVRVFSALGALRIAMILQQSQVAAQVRTIILDLVAAVPSITAATIFRAFQEVYEWLNKNGVLKKFLYLDEEILIALDGTEYFSSKKINCPHCNCRNHRNGTTTYFHGCVTPIVVSPNQKQVINLEPEFIKKQDGYQKYDCENAAVKRWLNKNNQNKYSYPVTLLGDDLYSRQPICSLLLKQGYNFIYVCLKTSHKTLYDWLEFLERSGEVRTVEKKQWDGRKNLIYRYRYTSKVPLKDEDSSLEVNWCEVTVINEKTEEIIYQNNWITNHKITENNVEEIVKAGRSRWKVENEGNNVLKNHGYNLEHNFGHGENHLCELLLSLNLLAFLFHTVLDLVNYTYQKVRKILVTRTTFFKDIRTLLKYLWFKDWSHLFSLIITEHDPLKRVNSS